MTTTSPKQFTGEVARAKGPGRDGKVVSPYIASPGLVDAVRISRRLERPLLLKGEPGCGKSKLASAVARELGMLFYEWHVKSTSRARDGLYTYDNVARLRDVALIQAGQTPQKDATPEQYRRFGALGRAFVAREPTVVLIDEIDKADIDFPNDLLLELDEKRFVIDETGEEIAATHAPLIIVTSNDERDLPDAFLRRCVFHFVEFPSGMLHDIVRAHLPEAPVRVIERAVQRFHELRTRMKAEKGESSKLVGTSELIDWVRILADHPADEALAKLDGKLPYDGVLLKNWEDHLTFVDQKSPGDPAVES